MEIETLARCGDKAENEKVRNTTRQSLLFMLRLYFKSELNIYSSYIGCIWLYYWILDPILISVIKGMSNTGDVRRPGKIWQSHVTLSYFGYENFLCDCVWLRCSGYAFEQNGLMFYRLANSNHSSLFQTIFTLHT